MKVYVLVDSTHDGDHFLGVFEDYRTCESAAIAYMENLAECGKRLGFDEDYPDRSASLAFIKAETGQVDKHETVWFGDRGWWRKRSA